MKSTFATAMVFTAAALAMPTIQQRQVLPIYGPSNPVIDSSCPVPSSSTPLGGLYPTSNWLGGIIGPILAATLGAEVVNDIDAVADQLCISAQQDPADGNGICQDTFDALRAFVDADTPLDQSQEYGCLLDLICVSYAGPQNSGTCDYLLAGADCNANRIVGVGDLECD